MADKKITALTAKTALELTDLICIVDMTAVPNETKKITVANFLVSMRIRQGETDSRAVTTAGFAFVFTDDIGTDVTGADYELVISCTDALNSTEQIGYVITARSETGFTITPIKDAWVEYTAILK